MIIKVNKRGSAFFLEKSFEPFLSKTLGWFIRRYFHEYSTKTTLEVLSSLTKNKELIAVLCGQCVNYDLSPDKSSFVAHAMVVNHFMKGGYYPIGGADEIAHKTINTLLNYDAQLFVKANVTAIETRNNKVTGVTVNGKFIACKSVISNAGVHNTFKNLLSNSAKKNSLILKQYLHRLDTYVCMLV